MSAIYKVHIGSSEKCVKYTVYDTSLATVTYRDDTAKFEISCPDSGIVMIADSLDEADKNVREHITQFFARLGIVPNFIVEESGSEV